LRILDIFKNGLKKALEIVGRIDSIGVCTWGVDFALYESNGHMLQNPLSYRNTIGQKYLGCLSDEEKDSMFYETGILCDKINSVYMLRGIKEMMPDIFNAADKLLMVPDIINYMLTGKMINEPSEFSTSQLLRSSDKKISKKICSSFNIPEKLFSPIGRHGEIIGYLLPHIKQELNIDYDIPVICTPSHDTASAVMAIPASEDVFPFISSGTWSLIGTEIEEPMITKEVKESNLTNEVGAFNKITLLKNSAGMFIIQRIKKEYDAYTGVESTWDELDKLAGDYIGPTPLFDVNNNRLFNPKHMGQEIWNCLLETKQAKGNLNWGIIIKAVHESMACCYAVTISSLEIILGRKFKSIYIVGGGSKNVMVNLLTAKRTGKKVITCSKESTSLGNNGAQIKYFEKDITISGIRKILSNSIDIREYVEEYDNPGLTDSYSSLSS
jgi:sugar (pentulose or hexulose) kinase